MNEFEYISPDNDDDSIKYILDCRYTDQIEYLVRYKNPKYIYDCWVKSSDLTCYKKLIDFYDGKFPSSIVKKLMPENSDNDKFMIYGAECINNKIMLKVHIPDTEGIVIKNIDDLKNDYMDEIVEYYETHLLENK